MFDLLLAISFVGTVVQVVKEKSVKTIPADNWANKELYYKDIASGITEEQRIKNVENGKYAMTNNHPEPHRDPVSGKIVIENCQLYYEDAMKYGAYQAQQWVKQGKYNLSPEELEKEDERIKNKYKSLYNL